MSRLPAQLRAEHALKQIEALAGAAKDTRKSYQAYVKGLPATIITGGLGQAVALCMARSGEGEGNKDAYGHLIRHLEEWLCVDCGWSPYRLRQGETHSNKPHGLALMKQITTRSQADYVLAQSEAILYLDWLKKLANALLVDAPTLAAGGESAT